MGKMYVDGIQVIVCTCMFYAIHYVGSGTWDEKVTSSWKSLTVFMIFSVNIISENIFIISATEMEVVRALVIIAVLLMALPICIVLLKMFAKKEDDRYMKISGGITCSAGEIIYSYSLIFDQDCYFGF